MSAAATTAKPAGTLVGPAGGTWEQGMATRALCACCRSWVIDEPVWRYAIGPIVYLTICVPCATGAGHEERH